MIESVPVFFIRDDEKAACTRTYINAAP